MMTASANHKFSHLRIPGDGSITYKQFALCITEHHCMFWRCDYCRFQIPRRSTLRCTCRMARYCDVYCQTRAWPQHKSACLVSASSQITFRQCDYCNFPVPQGMISTCPCRTAKYCDGYCQRRDWQRHKPECVVTVLREMSWIPQAVKSQIISYL